MITSMMYLSVSDKVADERDGKHALETNVEVEVQHVTDDPGAPPIVWVKRPNKLDQGMSADLGFMAW